MFEVTYRDDIDGAHGRIAKIEGQIARLLEMAADLKTTAPVLRKVDALEDDRTAIEQQAVAWQNDDEAAMALHAVTDAHPDDDKKSGRWDGHIRPLKGFPGVDP
jgi:hypothetical protein